MICYLSIVAIFSKFYKSHFVKINMEDEIPRIGPVRQINMYEHYSEKIVLVSSKSGTCFGGGKVSGIERECIVLNPFTGFIHSLDGSGKYTLLEADKRITFDSIGIMEPTTMENLIGYCVHQNKQFRKPNKIREFLRKYLQL
jgi:hypothetical protein